MINLPYYEEIKLAKMDGWELVNGRVENGGSGGARTCDKSNASLAKTDPPSQIASQESGATGQDLSRVVTSWPKLPAPLKAAILAIIQSVEGARHE